MYCIVEVLKKTPHMPRFMIANHDSSIDVHEGQEDYRVVMSGIARYGDAEELRQEIEAQRERQERNSANDRAFAYEQFMHDNGIREGR